MGAAAAAPMKSLRRPEVGTLEETITVTADAPLIETSNASVGRVIDTQALEAIPTAGRSVFLMATLEPTVQASPE